MRTLFLRVSVCAMTVLAACGHQQDERATEEANRVFKVKADTVRVTKSISKLHYSGTIEPLQTIPLSFESVGNVENVFVQEGDVVRRGQVLATIDKNDDVSLSKAAEAKYQQAKDAYNRLKSVYEKGSLSEIKWVEIETSLKEAESQMQLAKSSIAKCTLRAPTSGMIGKRNIEPGQNTLSLEDPLVLVKIETILVKISVAENEICFIKKGQKATFSISALHGKTFTGTVSNVGIVADQISRTYQVKIMAANPTFEIKPGMVCDVNLDTEITKECIIVSNNAVSKDQGINYVFVINPDKKTVKRQEVSLGDYHDNGIEVLEGIHPRQIIVVEGKEKLSDNSLISL